MKTESQNIPVDIRWMIRRDMPEVSEIETDAFEFPWRQEDFLRCLRQRNYIGKVAELDGLIAGYMIYELHEDHYHVLNLAVRSDVRRQGIGRQLINNRLEKISTTGRRNRLALEVREANFEAQVFFKKMGLKATSVLKNYYDQSDEDAYVFQYRCEPEVSELALPSNRIARLA